MSAVLARSTTRRTVLVAVTVAVATLAAVPTLLLAPASAGSSSYNLSYQTFPDGHRAVARWNPCQKAVTYRVNTTYSGSTSSARLHALSDVKAAFARLSKATGMTFRYAGSTTSIPKDSGSVNWAARESSGEIYVAWVKQTTSGGYSDLLGQSGSGWAAGSGGYAYKFWKVGSDPWRGVTGRGFVVLDSAQNSKFASGFGSGTTRGDLLLHELGHVVGLNHVTTKAQVMYPTIQPKSASGYSSGDALGLSKLGRSQGCIDAPSWVWQDLS